MDHIDSEIKSKEEEIKKIEKDLLGLVKSKKIWSFTFSLFTVLSVYGLFKILQL